MVAYDLSHLTQAPDQAVSGPIQDDEALFLFGVVRGRCIRTVLELGGLSGYSATNFLRAVAESPGGGKVFTVDLDPVPKLAPNHFPIQKDARDLAIEDVHGEPLGLVFFDCHDYDAQMAAYAAMVDAGLVTRDTVLALHDTNTHPRQTVNWAYATSQGWVHQPAERRMVNAFRAMGYDAFLLHTDPAAHEHEGALPYRHGVALCTRVAELEV